MTDSEFLANDQQRRMTNRTHTTLEHSLGIGKRVVRHSVQETGGRM